MRSSIFIVSFGILFCYKSSSSSKLLSDFFTRAQRQNAMIEPTIYNVDQIHQTIVKTITNYNIIRLDILYNLIPENII